MRKPLILLFLLASCFAKAQDSVYTNFIGIAPQWLLFNQVKLTAEHMMSPKSAIAITPVIYFGETSQYSSSRRANAIEGPSNANINTDKVQGFGLEVMHDIFLEDKSDKTDAFFSYGFGMHQIHLSYTDYGWSRYYENNLEYYRFDLVPQTEVINRIDIIALLGSRFHLGLLELKTFLGPVYNMSTAKNSLGVQRSGNTRLYDFGSTGLTLRVGFTIGIKL